MGANALWFRPGLRPVLLRHRRLRLGDRRVRGWRRRPARHARGVHPRRCRRKRLLRRQPRGRLQPADGRGAAGRRWRELRRYGLLGGPERAVPRRPEGGGAARVRLRRHKHRLQERVRGVRPPGVLLQRGLQRPDDVPAVPVLAVLQEGVPACVQLRVRRRQLHLHLCLRHRQLPRRLLSQHFQPEVIHRQPDPVGPAFDQRHGVLPWRRPRIEPRLPASVRVRRRCARVALHAALVVVVSTRLAVLAHVALSSGLHRPQVAPFVPARHFDLGPYYYLYRLQQWLSFRKEGSAGICIKEIVGFIKNGSMEYISGLH